MITVELFTESKLSVGYLVISVVVSQLMTYFFVAKGETDFLFTNTMMSRAHW